MADQIPRVRPWSESDFFSEMQSKPWWRQPGGCGRHLLWKQPRPIGAVTLAMREGSARTIPVVHWLLVDPAWRRRGVGRLLDAHLEQAAWNDGWREIELETHAGWTAAVDVLSIDRIRARARSFAALTLEHRHAIAVRA